MKLPALNPYGLSLRQEAGDGDVWIQWRCRGNHAGCEGQRWHRHSVLKGEDAPGWVAMANEAQELFDYRVKRY